MISVQNLCVKTGEFSLSGISFEIPTGGYGVLMGRNGSGKTTILECICGLRSIQLGHISLMGRDATRLKPGERSIGYVPQDGVLFAAMTVREQLNLSLVIRKWKQVDIEKRLEELSNLLSISHLLKRKPHELSGGEIQRVALGRALASKPGILCLDEPLNTLDDQTHEEMCELLISVRRQTGVTTLHVTHSRREMERLADHLYIIENGLLSQLQPNKNDNK